MCMAIAENAPVVARCVEPALAQAPPNVSRLISKENPVPIRSRHSIAPLLAASLSLGGAASSRADEPTREELAQQLESLPAQVERLEAAQRGIRIGRPLLTLRRAAPQHCRSRRRHHRRVANKLRRARPSRLPEHKTGRAFRPVRHPRARRGRDRSGKRRHVQRNRRWRELLLRRWRQLSSQGQVLARWVVPARRLAVGANPARRRRR
jgi:hypothetical protein